MTDIRKFGFRRHFLGGLFTKLVSFCCVVLLASSSYGQDPFTDGVPTIDPNLPSADQAIIRAVQQSTPQTPVELAKALGVMMDLESIPEGMTRQKAAELGILTDSGATKWAKFYLGKLRSLALDDQQKFELYDQIGANFFFELQFRESLAPEGEQFATDIIRAANRAASSPDRLQQLIRRLSSPDLSTRNEALRTLRKLGPQATAEILHVFVDTDRKAEFPYLRSALRLMGNDALPPLLAGARANHLMVQAESVRALSYYPSAEAMDAKMRTYLSPKLPESLRRIALDALMRIDRLPADPQIVENCFYDRAIGYLKGKMSAERALLGDVEIYRWDVNAQKLVASKVAASQANQMLAARLASDLYEINSTSDRNRQLMLLTRLESEKRLMGPSMSMTAQRLIAQMDDEVSFEEMERVLNQALKWNLIPAATAACEVLGELGQNLFDDFYYPVPASLIEAIKVGDRHLQFAAFEAIRKLDPQRPYAGSSLVLSLAIFFSFNQGQDAAIIGDGRIDIAQTYAGLMSNAGLIGVAAFNGKQLFANAIQNPDVSLIMISDSLAGPNVQQLIQQLRNDIRTKRIPIGLLLNQTPPSTALERLLSDKNSDDQLNLISGALAAADVGEFIQEMPADINAKRAVVDFVRNQATTSLALERLAANDPLLQVFPMSLEVEHIASQIRRVQQSVDPWSVKATDRKRHAYSAIEWLAQISNNGQKYRFYDLVNRQEDLARILYIPNSAEPATRILQALGTPTAQRELINFVGQSNFPIEDRRKAAAAFMAVIKRNGTLLTREEILRQYSRYNASETESAEIQQLLGSVLDALESNYQPN